MPGRKLSSHRSEVKLPDAMRGAARAYNRALRRDARAEIAYQISEDEG
jgi:hypothetical protein